MENVRWFDMMLAEKVNGPTAYFLLFLEEFAEIIEVKEQIILVSSWQVLRIAWRDKK